MTPTKIQQRLAATLAIVAFGALIAGAVMWMHRHDNEPLAVSVGAVQPEFKTYYVQCANPDGDIRESNLSPSWHPVYGQAYETDDGMIFVPRRGDSCAIWQQ